ncbi:GH36-type glycosyl hydrolase domain-containing protein [Ruthenibacterium lactatiformans]|uniref:GH36-type glycosyl hydrolase domain-containing protein n=1 Tax=Ruthenibacterium lactatiformans TaxID=1550024 RepID=UPI00397E90D7
MFGQTDLEYRDTAQDAMAIYYSTPKKRADRIRHLMQELTSSGYRLHLVGLVWFGRKPEKPVY